MIKIVLLGNWGLGAAALKTTAGAPGFDVVKVITRYDPAKDDYWYNLVWNTARSLEIPAYNYLGGSRKEIAHEMLASTPDILLSVSYSKILKKHELRIPKLGAVNIHPSLLPKYRGADPLSEIIKNRDRVAGQTAHFMDEGVDTGDIIDSESFEISTHPTREEILEKHNIAVVRLLQRVLGYFSEGNVPRTTQKEIETETA